MQTRSLDCIILDYLSQKQDFILKQLRLCDPEEADEWAQEYVDLGKIIEEWKELRGLTAEDRGWLEGIK